MSLVIRYHCHACGAPVQAQGRAAWVRCSYCRALVGYDWQAWFESPEYFEWLRNYPAQAHRFTDVQKHMDAAREAVKQGNPAQAEPSLREASVLSMELLPQTFPPEVRQDAAYRERYIRYDAWVRLQWMADPAIAALDTQVMAISQATDFSNPLPSLEKLLELQRRQFSRLESLPGAEDPDGMPPASRARLSLSSLVSAYLPMLTPPQRLELLRGLHGVNNVREEGAPTDELGFYIDWKCPKCSLYSLQGRGATVAHCFGCLYTGPLSARESEPSESSTRCGSCGHAVTLAAGKMEVACVICGSVVRRLARTDSGFRDYVHGIMAEQGHSLPGMPAQGVPGLRVTSSNRMELVLMGLARQANQFARILQPSRYAELVRLSLPGTSGPERAAQLKRVMALSATEHGDDAARKLLQETRTLLLR